MAGKNPRRFVSLIEQRVCDHCDLKDFTTRWRQHPLLRMLCDTCNQGQLIFHAEVEKRKQSDDSK